MRDRQHVTQPTPPDSPPVPDGSKLNILLRDVCRDCNPRRTPTDIDKWVEAVEDKLHLVGIHTVDHLFTNLPRLNWLMDRVHRNEFHLMTLKTMHKFIITGRYGEFNPPDRLVFTPCAYMATGPDDPPL